MIRAERHDNGIIEVEVKGETSEVIEECAGAILGCVKSVSKSENLPIKETFACLMRLLWKLTFPPLLTEKTARELALARRLKKVFTSLLYHRRKGLSSGNYS